MISPFEVYLVMQLDSIRSASGIFGLVFSVAGLFVVIFGFTEDETWGKWVGSLLLASGLLGFLLATFLPSTKTAAAMLILPAITSEEVVKPLGNEAKELYDLAKDALRKAVDAPAPKPTEVGKTDVE